MEKGQYFATYSLSTCGFMEPRGYALFILDTAAFDVY